MAIGVETEGQDLLKWVMLNKFESQQPWGVVGTPLQIYLLGPPGVEWDHGSFPIPRRQARALLYYLAACPRPVTREQVCVLFWPDTPELSARRSLSRLLNHLRRALPTAELLLADDDYIGINPHYVWSDVTVFEQLCSQYEAHQRVELLQQAVNLYGGPFLAGFSLSICPEFEAWLAQERQIWERLYLKALGTLVEVSTTRGNSEEAILYAQRYLSVNDLAEDMHCRLIKLYAANGDRCAALRQFEQCVTLLEHELGVSPLPETWAAYQDLQKGCSPAPPLPLFWTTLPSLNAPLVGRDEALCCLKQAYCCVRSGHGRILFISGEPGIGKSRLIQEFVTQLAGESTLIVGSGHEDERNLPYGLLVEALSPHLPALGPTLPGFEPLHLAELAGLWPELHKVLPNLPDRAPLELSQGPSLFQALAHLLLYLAAQRPPLILCLDDLHWADDYTLAWLGYLARQLKHTPLLILGAYRPEEVATITTLRTELSRLGLLQEVRLERLSQLEVLALIRHLLGQNRGAERLSQRLHEETGGNAFFLLETLRLLCETGLIWQDETGWSTGMDETTEACRALPLPDTVAESIRSRLSRLSSQARQALEAGAALGYQFNFDLVSATTDLSERELVEALEALLAHQLIAEHEGKYRFNHNFIRAVIYRDLSYGRRRLLHRRTGKFLLETL